MDNRIVRTLILLLSLLALSLVFSCDREEGSDPEQSIVLKRGTPRDRQEEEIEIGDLSSEDSLKTAKKTEEKEEKPAKKDGISSPLAKFEYNWSDASGIPDIVIVVDDFGNSAALLEDYAQLPSEVVFAVLPDLSATQRSGQVASQNGHEVIIHVPMQAEGGGNPGKRYIKTNSTSEEIAELITAFKSQLPMAIGANNHMGSAVTANRDVLETVLRELHSHKLFFLDSYTSGSSKGPSLARTLGYPALKRDMFLDVPDSSDATLAAKINSLSKFKGRREPIVIITHCHNREKLAALQKFITQIKGMGLKLTTLSRARNIAA